MLHTRQAPKPQRDRHQEAAGVADQRRQREQQDGGELAPGQRLGRDRLHQERLERLALALAGVGRERPEGAAREHDQDRQQRQQAPQRGSARRLAGGDVQHLRIQATPGVLAAEHALAQPLGLAALELTQHLPHATAGFVGEVVGALVVHAEDDAPRQRVVGDHGHERVAALGQQVAGRGQVPVDAAAQTGLDARGHDAYALGVDVEELDRDLPGQLAPQGLGQLGGGALEVQPHDDPARGHRLARDLLQPRVAGEQQRVEHDGQDHRSEDRAPVPDQPQQLAGEHQARHDQRRERAAPGRGEVAPSAGPVRRRPARRAAARGAARHRAPSAPPPASSTRARKTSSSHSLPVRAASSS